MKAPWSRSRHDGTEEPIADASRALLISIQPRFANAILDGTKTIELRRTMPTLAPGAVALIYSSSPIKALVGWATVEEIVTTTPRALWREHRASAGVTSAEFNEYFAGRDNAHGLRLDAVQRADTEISLADLRGRGLEPPQSWRYVATSVAEALVCTMTDETTGNRSIAASCTG